MKRMRIGTLMLLVAERWRSTRLMDRVRMAAEEARGREEVARRAQAQITTSQGAAPDRPEDGQAAARYGQELTVIVGFAESVVEDLAKEKVGAEVTAALVAAADLPGNPDLADVGAAKQGG